MCEIRRRDLYKSHDFSLNDFLGREKKLNLMPRQSTKKSRAVNSIREIIEQGQAVIFYLTDFIEEMDVGYTYI